MGLSEWISDRGRGAIAQLARDTGLSYPTVFAACAGRSVRVETAKRIAAATEGAVSAAEILGVAEHTDNVAAEPAAGEG